MKCEECSSEDLTLERYDDGDVGGTQYWDDKYTCNSCGYTWWHSWTEGITPGLED